MKTSSAGTIAALVALAASLGGIALAPQVLENSVAALVFALACGILGIAVYSIVRLVER